MKLWKKTISMVVMIIALVSTPLSVMAEGTEYVIEENQMHIEIPSMYSVIMQGNFQDIDAFSKFGFSKFSAAAYLKSNNIYLDAIDDELRSELSVSIEPFDSIDDLQNLDDESFEEFRTMLCDHIRETSSESVKSEVYNTPYAKYLQLDFDIKVDGFKTFRKAYCTIKNNQIIYINYTILKDGPLALNYSEFRSIIDGITYGDQVKETETASQTAASTNKEASPVPDVNQSNTSSIGTTLLGILLTAFVMMAPIAAYRFGIRKKSVHRANALPIAFAYSLGGIVLTEILILTVEASIQQYIPKVTLILAVLFGWADYKILTWKNKENAPMPQIVHTKNPEEPDVLAENKSSAEKVDSIVKEPLAAQNNLYCRKCGKKLLPDSAFCNYCGAPVNPTADSKDTIADGTSSVQEKDSLNGVPYVAHRDIETNELTITTLAAEYNKHVPGYFAELMGSYQKGDFPAVISRCQELETELRPVLEKAPKNSYCFTSQMSFLMFVYRHKSIPEDITWIDSRLSEVLMLKGSAYTEMHMDVKAQETLAEAARINPTCVDINCEYATCLLKLDQLIEAEEVLRGILPYCIYPNEFARVYRTFGAMFLKSGKIDAAETSYIFSMLFEPSGVATNEMYFIESQIRRNATQEEKIASTKKLSSGDSIKSILGEENIPYEGDDVLRELLQTGTEENDRKALEQYETIGFISRK